MSHTASVAVPPRPASYNRAVALVLQGGGALGSYQAGIYEALATSPYPPDWVAGISIGAVNAALIAGNRPERRVEQLRAFWNEVTTPPPPLPGWDQPSWADAAWTVPGVVGSAWLGQYTADALAGWALASLGDKRAGAAASALLFGQPGFFAPRAPNSWLHCPPPTSFYDTAALKSTLERLVDFDRINAGDMRFSVGAVNVATGNFAYFDNRELRIRPEHVMASGALPPGFPAVEIDGAQYWDGGLVSNTPLQYVLDYVPRQSRLTFQVDLFPARGALPGNLSEVAEREKDIRYSSRTRAGTDTMSVMQGLRYNINALWEKLSPELRATESARFLREFCCVTQMDIVELIYRPAEPQGAAKDFEFSRSTMEARWAQGVADMQATLQASPWLAPSAPEEGARTFDVLWPGD